MDDTAAEPSAKAIRLTARPRRPNVLLLVGPTAILGALALTIDRTTAPGDSGIFRQAVVAAFSILAFGWLVGYLVWRSRASEHAVLVVSGDEFSFQEPGRLTLWSRSEASVRVFKFRWGGRSAGDFQAALEVTLGTRRVITVGGGADYRIPTNTRRGPPPHYVADYPEWKRLVAVLGLPPTG